MCKTLEKYNISSKLAFQNFLPAQLLIVLKTTVASGAPWRTKHPINDPRGDTVPPPDEGRRREDDGC